ncbi:S-layer homology domain-containing protein [Effusibacillus lacus]|nr:S-layer homology domain-containing protein [Effusibacillus lacus]TCS72304.1 S-layer family protein [Effusibacillus lacus]
MANKLIVNGVGNGTFNPEGSVTRAQFAAMLANSLGLRGKAANHYFTDVAADSWYAPYVDAVYKAGLVKGVGEGRFAPEQLITREEMAVLVMRALKFTGQEPSLSSGEAETLTGFADKAAISAWAKQDVAKAVKAGIVKGFTDGTFGASQSSSRAQAVVMITNLLNTIQFN